MGVAGLETVKMSNLGRGGVRGAVVGVQGTRPTVGGDWVGLGPSPRRSAPCPRPRRGAAPSASSSNPGGALLQPASAPCLEGPDAPHRVVLRVPLHCEALLPADLVPLQGGVPKGEAPPCDSGTRCGLSFGAPAGQLGPQADQQVFLFLTYLRAQSRRVQHTLPCGQALSNDFQKVGALSASICARPTAVTLRSPLPSPPPARRSRAAPSST